MDRRKGKGKSAKITVGWEVKEWGPPPRLTASIMRKWKWRFKWGGGGGVN